MKVRPTEEGNRGGHQGGSVQETDFNGIARHTDVQHVEVWSFQPERVVKDT
jgi:hypothetical protein